MKPANEHFALITPNRRTQTLRKMSNYSDLKKELHLRRQKGMLRNLSKQNDLIDFASNDYFGLSKTFLGSTGSRLLTGNSKLSEAVERKIAHYHGAEAALLFSSGYMANVGLISALSKRNSIILYDSLVHASTRDGIRLSFGKSYSFKHNDLKCLEKQLKKHSYPFVCVEAAYSTDGSLAPLHDITNLCKQYGARLIVDEAHTVGIFGPKGEGLANMKETFATIVTFGKALGGFGAAVLGSKMLKKYLINFANTAIFTTALPLPILLAIQSAYEILPSLHKERLKLHKLMKVFDTPSPIKTIPVKNCREGKAIAKSLAEQGFHVSLLMPPTVAQATLRISLHSFNSVEDAEKLKEALRL